MKNFNLLQTAARVAKASPWLHNIYYSLQYRFGCNRVYDCGNHNQFNWNRAVFKNVKLTIQGNHNTIQVEPGARVSNVEIIVCGSGNVLTIGQNCAFSSGSVYFGQNNNRITIGQETTISQAALTITETDCCITIGCDCMLAWGIDIRCGDGHPIIDLNSKKKLNQASSIEIGDHVWLAADVQILKGVSIGENSVIGSRSLVTKNIPTHCVAAGIPAKVIREKVTWLRK